MQTMLSKPQEVLVVQSYPSDVPRLGAKKRRDGATWMVFALEIVDPPKRSGGKMIYNVLWEKVSRTSR